MRTAHISRETAETRIDLQINLDGSGTTQIQTQIAFFDHMLEQIARHGNIDIHLQAQGDIEVDDHHTVEDIGICLGQAIKQALGERRGIVRYGHAYAPLDETLSRVVIDISGRPGLYYHVNFCRDRIGQFDVDLVREFFQGVINHAAITVHIDNLRGENAHHQSESIFKAFGRALRMALAIDDRNEERIPSTKGVL